MTRIIVCGTRSWSNRQRIADRLSYAPPDATIVHGAAKGADRIAEQEAQKLGLLIERHPHADYPGGKNAPHVRNQAMAELGAAQCIAFWDGRSTGTLSMMEKAVRAGIPVDVVMDKDPMP